MLSALRKILIPLIIVFVFASVFLSFYKTDSSLSVQGFDKKIFKAKEKISLLIKQAEAKNIKTRLLYSNGKEVKGVRVTSVESGGDTNVSIGTERSFKPGKYHLEINSDGKNFEQDFRWGVLAINTNKSIYLPGETANIAIAVLDDVGNMVCNADVVLRVTDPAGHNTVLSTRNGKIKVDPHCSVKSFSLAPDYGTVYKTRNNGKYQMHLSATSENGTYDIEDSFEVRAVVDFDIERISATRIYPPESYPVTFKIKSNRDFEGFIKEYVPASFNITSAKGVKEFLSIETKGDTKEITWSINIKKGKEISLGYQFLAPKESPQFYTLGPLAIIEEGKTVFEEGRAWQIAADATAVIWMEAGTDSTFDISLFDNSSNPPTSDSTIKHNGPRSLRANSGAGNAASWVQKLNVIQNAGTRYNFWVYFDAFPNSGTIASFIQDSSGVSWNVRVDTNGQLSLYTSGTQLGTGSTLSTGTWYRITFDLVINSANDYHYRVFLNGVQDIDFDCNSCGTATSTTGLHILIGWDRAPGASKSVYFDDIYIDDGNDMADPGNIRVTAKLPTTANQNNFDSTNGTGAVNERPAGGISSNYKQHAASSSQNQTYNIESASAGDIDISSYTVVGRTAWVYTENGNGPLGAGPFIWDNGSSFAIATTTTPGPYFHSTLSSTYPSSSDAVGMTSTGGGADTFFYEGGMMVAYLVPVSAATDLSVTSQECASNGTVTTDYDWTPAVGTFFSEWLDWSTDIGFGTFTGTDVSATAQSGTATITGVTDNTTIYWRVNSNEVVDAWQISATGSYSSRNCNASKVTVTSTSSTLTANTCSGAGNPFTLTLRDQDDNARNPESSTVIQVTSNSGGVSIYSDSTCETPVSGGNFTFTTGQNTKTFYVIDTQASSWTLSATRTSGDTISTGAYNYSVTATGGLNIGPGLNINPGVNIQ